MSEKNLSPAKIIPHVVRKIRLLERALKQGRELNESGYICGDWHVVKRLINDEVGFYKRQLEYFRDEYSEVVAHFEALPRMSGYPPSSDPYVTGHWPRKYGNYLADYKTLTRYSRYGWKLQADDNGLDELPF
jgi:hypothetical protein